MLLASSLIIYLVSLTSADSACPPDLQLDVVFAVDSDGSTGEEDYPAFYKFMSETMDDFPVGNNQTRVGLVTSDTNPYTVIAPTGDRESILKKLRRIEYRHNTANAITCLNLAAGVFKKDPRSNVKTVVVFETDGTDKKNTALNIKMATRLKKQDIVVFVLGFKPRIDHQELVNMASKPEYCFEANSYSDYKEFVHTLASLLCNDEQRLDDKW